MSTNVETDNILKEEQKHLDEVVKLINEQQNLWQESLRETERPRQYMGHEIYDSCLKDENDNRKINEKIEDLESIKENPYYYRIDALTDTGKETRYVGEKRFPLLNGETIISSIVPRWFFESKILLIRALNIKNGKVASYKNINATVATCSIINSVLNEKTDPHRLNTAIDVEALVEQKEKDVSKYIMNNDDIQGFVKAECNAGSTIDIITTESNCIYKYSKEARINNKVKLMTLQEYYLEILTQFKKIHSLIISKNHSCSFDIELDNFHNTNKKTISNDEGISQERLEYIYSGDFKEAVEFEFTEDNKHLKRNDYFDTVIEQFKQDFKLILKDIDNDTDIPNTSENSTCVLFAKLEYLLTFYKNKQIPKMSDKVIIFVENHDFIDAHYNMIKNFNPKMEKYVFTYSANSYSWKLKDAIDL